MEVRESYSSPASKMVEWDGCRIRYPGIQGCQQPELPEWPRVSLLTSRGPASIPHIPALLCQHPSHSCSMLAAPGMTDSPDQHPARDKSSCTSSPLPTRLHSLLCSCLDEFLLPQWALGLGRAWLCCWVILGSVIPAAGIP